MSDPLPVDVTSHARLDSLEVALYIMGDSPAAGHRFLDAFEATLLAIAEYPESGALTASAARDLRDCRTWPVRGFENWLVFYRIHPDTIVVSRVLHGARDF
jgi:toxin ParE1/3/4